MKSNSFSESKSFLSNQTTTLDLQDTENVSVAYCDIMFYGGVGFMHTAPNQFSPYSANSYLSVRFFRRNEYRLGVTLGWGQVQFNEYNPLLTLKQHRPSVFYVGPEVSYQLSSLNNTFNLGFSASVGYSSLIPAKGTPKLSGMQEALGNTQHGIGAVFGVQGRKYLSSTSKCGPYFLFGYSLQLGAMKLGSFDQTQRTPYFIGVPYIGFGVDMEAFIRHPKKKK